MDNIFVPQCMAILAPFQQKGKKKHKAASAWPFELPIPIFPAAAFWGDD
jgi:hypothetical protein